jgi:hypothetical protein
MLYLFVLQGKEKVEWKPPAEERGSCYSYSFVYWSDTTAVSDEHNR